MKSSSLFALSLIGALAFGQTASAAVETYEIDNVHSSVGFSIRHNLVAKVQGSFTQFKGTLRVDRDHLESSTVEATIQAASLSTANEKRDNHLRSPDFFDVATYPTLSFKSKSWKHTGGDNYDVAGDLTIHGVTKEVVLKVTSLGFGPGAKPGSSISGWEATTTINRRDFGVNGPAMLGRTVGDEVQITILVEAGKQ